MVHLGICVMGCLVLSLVLGLVNRLSVRFQSLCSAWFCLLSSFSFRDCQICFVAYFALCFSELL